MTLSRHPQWDVFFITPILAVMTLSLFIVNLFSKLYWAAWDIDAWKVTPKNSTELSEPAKSFSRVVYGISTFEHEVCQQRKKFDASEQCPIFEHKHVLKLGKNNLTKIWDAKFKLAWIRRSECCHYYEWLQLSHKNLSNTHSMNYSSKALIAKAKLRAISQFKKFRQLQLVTPELNYLEVLKQRCAHGVFLSYFAKFSRKLFCLAPDEDVPVGLITGQSRQMGNSTETVYQYSAINPTGASPASWKLEQSTFRLIVQQLQRHINLLPTDKTVTRSSPPSPTLLSSTENRIKSVEQPFITETSKQKLL